MPPRTPRFVGCSPDNRSRIIHATVPLEQLVIVDNESMGAGVDMGRGIKSGWSFHACSRTDLPIVIKIEQPTRIIGKHTPGAGNNLGPGKRVFQPDNLPRVIDAWEVMILVAGRDLVSHRGKNLGVTVRIPEPVNHFS